MSGALWVWAGAGYHVALGLFHLGFWRLFQWKQELPRLHPLNRGVLQVLNLVVIYVFFATAAVQLIWTKELLTTGLGRTGLGVITGFWLLRCALQPFFWPRTPLCWAFTAVFASGALLHGAALWQA